MLKLKNVSKFYYNKRLITSGFSKINLEFKIGEFVAITGASGSGKSTLLNVLSGLDSYEEGEMYINGEETSHYTEKDFEEYRRKYVSNIFQNFNLVNSYTVYQNIELVLLLNGYNKKEVKDKIIELLKKVDMYKFKNTKVSKLSGGQKQRVAIARALAKETPIIIADEPTGSLDSNSASKIIQLLSYLAKDKLVIIVTHNFEQVEKYVTRKIIMNDGKVLEDVTLTKVNNSKKDIVCNDFKTISNINKIRLGIRNAFNIKTKFLLILAVFLFLIFAISSEYSFNKNDEYLESIDGYNYYFDSNPKRIIAKKENKTEFNELDYQNINNIIGVNNIIKHDTLLDVAFSFGDKNDEYYLYGHVRDVVNIKAEDLSYGRMPSSKNEIVISGNKDYNYFLSDHPEKLLNMEILTRNDYQEINTGEAFKIVGIILEESSNYDFLNYMGNFTFYGNDEFLEYFSAKTIDTYSTIKQIINNKDYNYLIRFSNLVPKGEAYIDETFSDICKDDNCKNEDMQLNINNIYYSSTLNLKITNTYNNTSIKKLLNIDNYEMVGNCIYINDEEYFNLFKDKNYQISIIVNDDTDLYRVNNELNNLGLDTLVIKDTFYSTGTKEIMGLFKDFLMIGLLIALFFITHFIIKLILKSRNTYYAILRILGSSRKVSKHLLTIELLTVSSLSYLIFLGIIMLTQYGVLKLNLTTMIKYLGLKEYIIIYLITTLMSYLISLRYARKLFKDSTMNTIREEV